MTTDMSISRLGLRKNACGTGKQAQANNKAKSFHGSSAPSRAGAQRSASAQNKLSKSRWLPTSPVSWLGRMELAASTHRSIAE
jgi:hypothetical protein